MTSYIRRRVLGPRSSSDYFVGVLVHLDLDAMNAVPKEAALPTINTKPMVAQFTFGNMNTGSPYVVTRYIPEAAKSMPKTRRASILNIFCFGLH